MRARALLLLITVVLLATIAACGPSEEEQSATATAIAAEVFATQTASAPTATNTPTPTPTPTDTPKATPTNTPSPTATPVPTNTPAPSPTPTPDYSNTGLTLADMPEGFVADPDVAELFVVGQELVFPVPSTIVTSFGYGDEENYVNGFSAVLDVADIPAFDEQIDFLNQHLLANLETDAGVESDLPAEEPAKSNDIGEIVASNSVTVTDDASDSKITDVLTFRRGNVFTFLAVIRLASGEQPLDIAELARLIDQRIMASIEATGSGQTAAVPESDFDLYAGLGEDAFETTGSGLRYAILEEGGTGQQVEAGQVVSVHYTGWLEDGTSFDSSFARGVPFTFQLGQEMVIAGWEEGIALLEVGDKARLIIPSNLAYGEAGSPPIPASATLIFDVEVLAVTDGPPEAPLAVDAADYVVTDSGLKYYDIVVGDGDSPAEGQLAIMDFTIWLDDGTMLGSTLAVGQPAPATVGSGQLLPGWEEGLLSMKVGGSRQLVIPPELAFGAAGSPDGSIPPNASIIVEMELLDIEDGG